MIRLIACDLDETLLDDSKNVPQENKEAIRRFEAAGGHFVVSTGRIYTSLKRTLQQLDAYGKKDHYVISTNGALITENDGRICFCQGVSYEKTMALIEYARQAGIGVEVFTGTGDLYYENIDEREKIDLPMFIDTARPLPHDPSFLKGQVIPKLLYERQDMAYLHRFVEAMPQALKEGLEISYSSDRFIELNHLGVSKGEALVQLAMMLNVSMEETMAIGDNYNDVSMLKAAGFSAVVANAPKEIQERCDYVCTRTYRECGVAEAIDHVMKTMR